MKVVNGILTDVRDKDIKDGVFLVPEGVKEIGRDAFRDCSSLRSITLPEGVKKIGSHVFQDCATLQSITLPEGLKTIESFMFSGCDSLQSITLPKSLQTIDFGAFHSSGNFHSIMQRAAPNAPYVTRVVRCATLRFIYIPATSIDERERITNLLPEELRSRVVAHQFMQRLPDMIDKEFKRILQSVTTNPMWGYPKNIPFFPKGLFTEINKHTSHADYPFYQKALRNISDLALPDSEEGFSAYEKEVKQRVDNTIKKLKRVLEQSSRQTDLYDIVKELIENTHNGRGTSDKESIKADKLHKLGQAILEYPADTWLEKEADFIEQIRTVCALRNNEWYFWKTPESIEEFNGLLVAKGFMSDATENTPLLICSSSNLI